MKRLRIGAIICGGLLIAAVIASCGGGTRSLAELDAQGLYNEGLQLYENDKYRQAIDYFQTIVFNYPGNSVVDTAQYYLGLSYFGNEEYELAAVEFNRLALNYPSSAFFQQALFMRAVSYFEATPEHPGLDQTELQRAIDQFEDFLIDFPESELVPDVRAYLNLAYTRMAEKIYRAGVVYERIGATKAAKIYFQKVVDDYTNTDFGPQAAYQLARMEMRLKDFDRARGLFESFVTAYPDHELAGEAREQAVEAAYRHCEKTFAEGNYAEARQCLIQFNESYPSNGHADDVEDLLEKLDNLPAEEQASEHAGS